MEEARVSSTFVGAMTIVESGAVCRKTGNRCIIIGTLGLLSENVTWVFCISAKNITLIMVLAGFPTDVGKGKPEENENR